MLLQELALRVETSKEGAVRAETSVCFTSQPNPLPLRCPLTCPPRPPTMFGEQDMGMVQPMESGEAGQEEMMEVRENRHVQSIRH